MSNEDQRVLAAYASVIRALREERGMTIEQLAKRAALGVELVSKVESAEHEALLHELFAIAEALDVRPSHIGVLAERVLSGMS